MPLCAEDARPACPLAPESSCLYQLPRAAAAHRAEGAAPVEGGGGGGGGRPRPRRARGRPRRARRRRARTRTARAQASGACAVRAPAGRRALVSFAARAAGGFTTSRLEALCTAGWLCSHLSAAWYCGVPEGMSYVVNTRSCATRRAWRPTRHVRFERNDAVHQGLLPTKSFESSAATCVQSVTTIATARYISARVPVNAAAHDAPRARLLHRDGAPWTASSRANLGVEKRVLFFRTDFAALQTQVARRARRERHARFAERMRLSRAAGCEWPRCSSQACGPRHRRRRAARWTPATSTRARSTCRRTRGRRSRLPHRARTFVDTAGVLDRC